MCTASSRHNLKRCHESAFPSLSAAQTQTIVSGMAVLSSIAGIKDIIRQKLEEVTRGLSARSVRRYCAKNDVKVPNIGVTCITINRNLDGRLQVNLHCVCACVGVLLHVNRLPQ